MELLEVQLVQRLEVLKIRIIKTLHQINIINPHLLSSIIVIIIIRKFLGPQEGTGFQHHREGTGFQRHGDQFISTIINNNFGIRKIQLRKKMPLLPLFTLIIIACSSCQTTSRFSKRKQFLNTFQLRFQSLDIDDSGELSRAEFAVSQAAQRNDDPDNLFNSADMNSNGTLSSDEVIQVFRKLHRSRN